MSTINDTIYAYATLIRNRINEEIVWGTNNMPRGSRPEWFVGPNTGLPELPTPHELGYPGQMDAITFKRVMLQYLRRYANVRMMRCRRIRIRDGGVLDDNTALGFSATPIFIPDIPDSHSISTGYIVKMYDVNEYLEAIWNSYHVARAVVLDLIVYE